MTDVKSFFDSIQQGNLKDVRRILTSNISLLNKKNKSGQTALMGAAYRGHTKIVNLLLSKGSCIDVQGVDGSTALFLACMNGRMEAAEILVSAGASVNIQDEDRKTALDYCDGKKSYWGTMHLTTEQGDVLRSLATASHPIPKNHQDEEEDSHVSNKDSSRNTQFVEELVDFSSGSFSSSPKLEVDCVDRKQQLHADSKILVTDAITEEILSLASFLNQVGIDASTAYSHAQAWVSVRRLSACDSGVMEDAQKLNSRIQILEDENSKLQELIREKDAEIERYRAKVDDHQRDDIDPLALFMW